MYFSESVGVEYQSEFDWFDPILDTDTPLFVDPFLIFKERAGDWATAHEELIDYFQAAFEMLAPAWDNPADQRYLRTQTIMTFPEPSEFGLGFVAEGQEGSGTARGFAKKIVQAMADAIERGLQDLQHFEELGLLVPGIARDRISDITCNILKPRFIKYTQDVCKERGIDMVEVEVPSAVLDPVRKRRVAENFLLPVNRETNRPVILAPKRFLRQLPTLNSKDWWHFAEPELRSDLNLTISTSVDKDEIIRLARSRAESVREWSEARESLDPTPYDVNRDPAGLHNWLDEARKFVATHPLPATDIHDMESLNTFIGEIIESFRHYVEAEGGWRLLWNDSNGNPKHEDAIQLLFKAVVQDSCRAQKVTLDREVYLGRGPVDFVISTNSTNRVLLEIKKASSGKFVDGLEKQLVSYLDSDGCKNGWYMAVQFYETKSEVSKIRGLKAVAREASKKTGFQLRSAVIDATRKKSASKL